MPGRQETIGPAAAGAGGGDGVIAAPDCAGDGLAGIEGGVATTTLPAVGDGDRVAVAPDVEVQPATATSRARTAILARIKQG